jgi:hypothetical protein
MPLFQYSKTNEMLFLYQIYYELTASTIFSKSCTNNTWYIACVLCLLVATRVRVELVHNKLNTESASRWFHYTDMQCVKKVAVH